MSRKRSKYRPKGVNPSAHILAMQGVRMFDTASRNSELVPLHAAVGKVFEHDASKEDWRCILNALFMIGHLVKQKVFEDDGWLHQTRDTVSTLILEERACRYDEMVTLREITQYYALLLDNLTFAQYVLAKEAVAKNKDGHA